MVPLLACLLLLLGPTVGTGRVLIITQETSENGVDQFTTVVERADQSVSLSLDAGMGPIVDPFLLLQDLLDRLLPASWAYTASAKQTSPALIDEPAERPLAPSHEELMQHVGCKRFPEATRDFARMEGDTNFLDVDYAAESLEVEDESIGSSDDEDRQDSSQLGSQNQDFGSIDAVDLSLEEIDDRRGNAAEFFAEDDESAYEDNMDEQHGRDQYYSEDDPLDHLLVSSGSDYMLREEAPRPVHPARTERMGDVFAALRTANEAAWLAAVRSKPATQREHEAREEWETETASQQRVVQWAALAAPPLYVPEHNVAIPFVVAGAGRPELCWGHVLLVVLVFGLAAVLVACAVSAYQLQAAMRGCARTRGGTVVCNPLLAEPLLFNRDVAGAHVEVAARHVDPEKDAKNPMVTTGSSC